MTTTTESRADRFDRERREQAEEDARSIREHEALMREVRAEHEARERRLAAEYDALLEAERRAEQAAEARRWTERLHAGGLLIFDDCDCRHCTAQRDSWARYNRHFYAGWHTKSKVGGAR